ncbi:MAG: hypothetical protein KY447_08045 [Actinobacteria bacterium]|nr:hypothetical protein [Actinomycetota bacterium]
MSQLAEALEIKRANIRGQLSGLTRHLNSRWGHKRWPTRTRWNGKEYSYMIVPEIGEAVLAAN